MGIHRHHSFLMKASMFLCQLSWRIPMNQEREHISELEVCMWDPSEAWQEGLMEGLETGKILRTGMSA